MFHGAEDIPELLVTVMLGIGWQTEVSSRGELLVC